MTIRVDCSDGEGVLPRIEALDRLRRVTSLNGCLSSLHWKVAPGSSEVNLNLTLSLSVFFGAPLAVYRT